MAPLKQSCRTFNLEPLLFLEIFELPYKVESNLKNKASGNSVNMLNIASRQLSPPASFHRLPHTSASDTSCFDLSALPLRVKRACSAALRSPVKAGTPSSRPLLPSVFRQHRPAPTSLRCSHRALPASIEHVTAPPAPCEPSRTVVAVWFHWRPPRVAFLPRDRPHHRRARLIVASKLR